MWTTVVHHSCKCGPQCGPHLVVVSVDHTVDHGHTFFDGNGCSGDTCKQTRSPPHMHTCICARTGEIDGSLHVHTYMHIISHTSHRTTSFYIIRKRSHHISSSPATPQHTTSHMRTVKLYVCSDHADQEAFTLCLYAHMHSCIHAYTCTRITLAHLHT